MVLKKFCLRATCAILSLTTICARTEDGEWDEDWPTLHFDWESLEIDFSNFSEQNPFWLSNLQTYVRSSYSNHEDFVFHSFFRPGEGFVLAEGVDKCTVGDAVSMLIGTFPYRALFKLKDGPFLVAASEPLMGFSSVVLTGHISVPDDRFSYDDIQIYTLDERGAPRLSRDFVIGADRKYIAVLSIPKEVPIIRESTPQLLFPERQLWTRRPSVVLKLSDTHSITNALGPFSNNVYRITMDWIVSEDKIDDTIEGGNLEEAP